MSDEQNQSFTKMLKKSRDHKVTVIEIGAGDYIPTIRNLGEHILRSNKLSKMVRINPQNEEGISKNIITIQKGGLEALK